MTITMKFVKKEVCPMCGLLPGDKSHQCTFFARCRFLKLHDDRDTSDQMRCKLFRMFHSDFCTTCHRDKTACREAKIARILREYKKASLPHMGIPADAIADEQCRRRRRNFEPVVPAWWKQGDCDDV